MREAEDSVIAKRLTRPDHQYRVCAVGPAQAVFVLVDSGVEQVEVGPFAADARSSGGLARSAM
jgi:hypothetical protein